MSSEIRHTFEGYLVAYSSRAILFHGHYWEKPEWMPRSQVVISHMPEDDLEECIIKATSWICGKKSVKEFNYLDNSVEKEE